MVSPEEADSLIDEEEKLFIMKILDLEELKDQDKEDFYNAFEEINKKFKEELEVLE